MLRWGLLLVMAGTRELARAQVTPAEPDLGRLAASTGKQASDTIRGRGQLLHESMSCGNEFDFALGFSRSSRYGNNGYAPDPNSAQWPITLMLGKAARLIALGDHSSCFAVLDSNGVNAAWGPLTKSGNAGSDSPAGVVNRVYHDLYDSIDGVTAPACAGVATDQKDGTVGVLLTDACLARQIRAVVTDPGNGPWKVEWDNAGPPFPASGPTVTPELPGTSAGKLPCLSELKTKVKGLDGDWDMGVIQYTRLTSLLYRYGRASLPDGQDINAAIDVLNRRFLTLRSSPDQGATAREEFNLVTSCGNLPNQFGSAIDTVNGSGADPATDRYSQAANDALGKSFWDDLFRFLAAVLTVAAIAAGAALAGAVAGIIAGALGTGLAVAVGVAAVVGLGVFITFAFGGIQETENHLLMQNSSRYIKNKLMMAELSAEGARKDFDTISDLNEDVRTWLLDRLQRIAKEDFVEYNAKPYNSFSHASLLNLIDYACDVSWDYDASKFINNSDTHCDPKDQAIVTAASAVLDLSAAKDAVGSLEGRRFIPYRRLAEENYDYYTGRSMLELIAGADNQLAALQIWTGQMRHSPDGKAGTGTFGDLAWYSTSHYRPDPMILDIALDKSTPREQQYRHHTRERYASGNGWLITAGGTDEGPAQGFRSALGFTLYLPISGDVTNDQGVGVPTTLMTTALIAGANGNPEGRARIQQFLRFEGNKKDWGLLDQGTGPNGLNTGKPLWSFSDNNCVAGSFACGLTMRMPSDFDDATCRTKNVTRNFFIVDSTKCASFNANDKSGEKDIFIAIFRSSQGWGFFEVAQQNAYGRSIDAYANAVTAQNSGRFDSWNSAGSGDSVEYFAVTQNRLLKFKPKDEDFGADRRACGVVNHESGARLTISNVPAAQQGACLSVGPRIFIDLNDAKNPIRRGEGGLALEQFAR